MFVDACAVDRMRPRDVILVVMVTVFMTSRCHGTRSFPDAVQYDVDEKRPVGTRLGRGLVADARLGRFYSSEELSRLTFSLVRGLPPDLTSRYFTIGQSTGVIQVRFEDSVCYSHGKFRKH